MIFSTHKLAFLAISINLFVPFFEISRASAFALSAGCAPFRVSALQLKGHKIFYRALFVPKKDVCSVNTGSIL